MWWCFGCYFCLPVLFTILCQMATRNVNNDSSATQKQRNLDERSNQKRQQHQALERQLNCTLLALAVVYGVCALPEHVCNITLAYTHITISEDTATMLVLLHHFLLFFKSSVTPVLLLCLCKVGCHRAKRCFPKDFCTTEVFFQAENSPPAVHFPLWEMADGLKRFNSLHFGLLEYCVWFWTYSCNLPKLCIVCISGSWPSLYGLLLLLLSGVSANRSPRLSRTSPGQTQGGQWDVHLLW